MLSLHSALLSACVLALIHLIVLIALAIILVRIIRRFFLKTRNHLPEKLFAITLTVLFFSRTIQAAIIDPFFRLLSNLEELFYLITLYAGVRTDEEAAKVILSNPLDKKVIFSDVILHYPLASLLVAIAIAIILYYLIRETLSVLGPRDAEPAKPKTYLVYNLLIVATLILSLYLVIGVCIAIPWFDEIRKPTAYTSQTLDSTLKNTPDNDTLEFKVGASPFADTTANAIWDSTTKAAYAKVKEVPAFFGQCQYYVTDFKTSIAAAGNNRQYLETGLKQYSQNTYKSQKTETRSEYYLNYDMLAGSRTDKQVLFDQAVQGYLFSLQLRKENFVSAVTGMGQIDARNTNIRQSNIAAIRDMIVKFSGLDTKDSSRAYSYYAPVSQFISYSTFDPERLNYGTSFGSSNQTNWGVFEFVAGYLVRPQSTELVLLIGMLGFGLLGASILSFRQSEPDETMLDSFLTKPLIVRFGDVLARGFGAALIVYMATKAGLSVFSTGTSTNANGYMLLLACFAGAIFSQNVWNWFSTTFRITPAVPNPQNQPQNQPQGQQPPAAPVQQPQQNPQVPAAPANGG